MSDKRRVPISKCFKELAIRLQQSHIDYGAIENGQMPILMDGRTIGAVLPGGEMRIHKELVNEPTATDLIDRAGRVAAEVGEYMNLMDAAPFLQASGLDEPYHKLAEFNGYVLGGIESKYGVQFTTWMKDYDGTGLVIGNYFGNDYAGAKQNFAVRCGFINGESLFTPEQFTEIYRCCAEMLNERFRLTWEQEEMIEGIQSKILELVPDVNLRLQGLEPPKLEFPEQTM